MILTLHSTHLLLSGSVLMIFEVYMKKVHPHFSEGCTFSLTKGLKVRYIQSNLPNSSTISQLYYFCVYVSSFHPICTTPQARSTTAIPALCTIVHFLNSRLTPPSTCTVSQSLALLGFNASSPHFPVSI